MITTSSARPVFWTTQSMVIRSRGALLRGRTGAPGGRVTGGLLSVAGVGRAVAGVHLVAGRSCVDPGPLNSGEREKIGLLDCMVSSLEA